MRERERKERREREERRTATGVALRIELCVVVGEFRKFRELSGDVLCSFVVCVLCLLRWLKQCGILIDDPVRDLWQLDLSTRTVAQGGFATHVSRAREI